jgi:hypothetical protein
MPDTPFDPDEAPTKPETWPALIRQMSERVRAIPPGDIAVLQILREESKRSSADALKYMTACTRFVDRLLR